MRHIEIHEPSHSKLRRIPLLAGRFFSRPSPFGLKKKVGDQARHQNRPEAYQKAWFNTPKLTTSRWPFMSIALFLIIVALASFGVWFVVGSSYFTVTDIEVKGVVSPQTQRVIDQLRGRNIFLLGNRSTEAKLLREEPTLKAIRIVRGLPNFLQIEVLEREGYMSWHSGDKWYWLDREGVAFRALETPRGIQIYDEANIPVQLGEKVVARDFLTFIETLSVTTPSTSGLKLEKVLVGESTFSVRVMTDKGIEVVFNTIDQIDRQLDSLARIWRTKQSDITTSIDVRVPGYVYYK